MRSPTGSQARIGGSRQDWHQKRRLEAPRWSPALINVVGLTVLVFFMGGSSRADVWSLPVLRPIAILSLFYGLWRLSVEDIDRHRFLFGVSAAVVALIILGLIPLPPSIWSALPGRDLVVQIDAAAGLTGTWRPLSLAPDLTWNALFALSIPLAILVNGVHLSEREHRTVMKAVLAGGVLTMALALLQIAGGGSPAFYLYRSTSFGQASGLFANRNHEALFLAALMPILGYLLATRQHNSRRGEAKRFLTFAGLLVIVAFIVALGSRAGLAAGVIGLVAFALINAKWTTQADGHPRPRARLIVAAVAPMALVAIVGWAIFAGSATSIERLLESDDRQELRYAIWPIVRDSLPQFMPAGTGIGTYERVFRMLEPDAILRPTYSNHAHNDWLEVAMTGGAPGIVLMAIAVFGFVISIARVRSLSARSARAAGWTSLAIVSMAALGSVIDYPLRTPIISVLFALSCVWLALSLRPSWVDREAVTDRG